MNITYNAFSLKGRRPYQEDQVVAHEDDQGLLCAVFDGHGGPSTASSLSASLANTWLTKTDINTHFKTRLRETVRLLQERTKDHICGSTGSIVYISKARRKAYIAIIGDSPVFIGNKFNAVTWFGHNVRTNIVEALAAEKRGGWIYGGYLFKGSVSPISDLAGPGLQMARAFGDRELDSVLDRRPEIHTYVLGKGDFLLVASDGILYPGMSEDESAAETLKAIREGSESEALCQKAFEAGSRDNISAVLVKA